MRAYAARLAELPDEAAASDFTAPRHRGHNLVHALKLLTNIAGLDETRSGWAAGPVMLRGHARILAALNDDILGRAVLATPLYIEYAPDDA